MKPFVVLASRRDFLPGFMLFTLFAAACVLFEKHNTMLNLPCPMKTLTGFPCLACGGERALQAIAALQFGQSLYFNPLICIALPASAAYLIYWPIHLITGYTIAVKVSNRRKAMLKCSVLLFLVFHYVHLLYWDI